MRYIDMAAEIFNPNTHLMQIGSGNRAKDYLPVAWRLVWFRSICPDGIIETEMIHLDLDRETEEEASVWNNETRRSEKVIKRAPGFAVFRATIKDGNGGVATGTKSEKAASFPDFIEKAETGAIGRALAALGYGTQFTGDEFDERHRIADAPVDREQSNDRATSATTNRTPTVARVATNQPATVDEKGPMTEQQRGSINKLCQYLGKPPLQPDQNMDYQAAKDLIAQLSQEYRTSRATVKS
jgi:hypothetical protein